MKHVAGICVLIVLGSSAFFGQTTTLPANWIGTWKLDVRKSSFGASLAPGAPAGLTIVSQTLRIEQIAREIRLSGDTVFSDSTGTRSSHDDNRLSLDGKETLAGAISFSFRRIDDSTFDIISKVHINDRNLTEESRFLFSFEAGY